jgi:hypothetical protein
MLLSVALGCTRATSPAPRRPEIPEARAEEIDPKSAETASHAQHGDDANETGVSAEEMLCMRIALARAELVATNHAKHMAEETEDLRRQLFRELEHAAKSRGR